MTTPDLDRFRALAKDRRVIPVTRRLLADGDTPIALYRKLAGERPGTFLLESAENGRTWSRYSFIGVASMAALTVRDGRTHWLGTPPVSVPTEGDPLRVLRETIEALHTPHDPELPPFTGGMVGYLGYDIVRRLESVGDSTRDDLRLPELTMLLTSDLAVVDHRDGTVLLIANAINHNDLHTGVDEAYADAVRRLDRMTARLAKADPTAAVALPPSELPPHTVPWGGPDYQRAVETVKEYIRAGDAFQVVPSQRFETPCPAAALDVYRVLRATNPSPYMYLFRFEGEDGPFDVVGSSPEALVKVEDGRALLHPIAGTRPRGRTPREDVALGEELLADPKERAEHLMLVDLGRNDLGRVCEPGTVEVVDFMSVERYSHVMHIVSTVTGRLAEGRTAFDALTACFPAGTLSGAPKPRALQIIEEIEPTRRGLYGGCVGYLDFAGNADTAIAIRTALLRDGTAYVQAGAGVVADSDPVAEDTECRNKAAAVLRAVATAGKLRGSVEA
ncbi:anthranilate synthase component I [Streptomyces marincola]|uniref:anthranilate synthase component I n=1 Tax=Streptomyces marincola TaxID=2878388 RepID=UPI001CF18E08|nr:anthranilate synthase component I [Streptomyces marincola]UCM87329.1 anthranilate synthase component I [Streptomyces marincola]